MSNLVCNKNDFYIFVHILLFVWITVKATSPALSRDYDDDYLGKIRKGTELEFCRKREAISYRDASPFLAAQCRAIVEAGNASAFKGAVACGPKTCIYNFKCTGAGACKNHSMTLKFLDGSKPGADGGMRAILTEGNGLRTVFSDGCEEDVCVNYEYVSGVRSKARLIGGNGGWIIQVPKGDELTTHNDSEPEVIPGNDQGSSIGGKRMLRDYGLAKYDTTLIPKSIVLKPQFKSDGRTYTFVDAGPAGQCSQDLLETLRRKLPGSMRVSSDRNKSFKNLMSSIRGSVPDLIVRYHFFDCASGLTPARYHGLLCLAYQDQRTGRSPIWEACAYVDEDVSKRRGS